MPWVPGRLVFRYRRPALVGEHRKELHEKAVARRRKAKRGGKH